MALRVLTDDGREVADFAGLIAADGSRVDLVTLTKDLTPLGSVLRAELHAGECGHVVVVADATLFESDGQSPQRRPDVVIAAGATVPESAR